MLRSLVNDANFVIPYLIAIQKVKEAIARDHRFREISSLDGIILHLN